MPKDHIDDDKLAELSGGAHADPGPGGSDGDVMTPPGDETGGPGPIAEKPGADDTIGGDDPGNMDRN